MSDIVEKMRQEIVRRSDLFEEKTKGTKDEYDLYREHVRYVHRYVILLSEGSGADREVLELSDSDALLFIRDKLTRDRLEISEGLKALIQDKYDKGMRAETVEDLGI